MIGVLLGAGASYGSYSKNTPPLGRSLYSAIKDHYIGAYITENSERIKNITIDQVVTYLSSEAKSVFLSGDFENGMGVLESTVKKIRSSKDIKLETGEASEYGSDGIPNRIMSEVAIYLYDFKPHNENLYFPLCDILPNGSHIFTLNYDRLFELVCLSKQINLNEHRLIQKQHFTHPTKSFNFYQLHGGASLHSMWPPKIFGLSTMQVNTDKIQRINARAYIANGIHFDISVKDYATHFSSNIIIAYYNKNKYVSVAPKLLLDIQNDYIFSVEKNIDELLIIGCRYLQHDDHIWKPINDFKGKIHWVGDQSIQHLNTPNINILGSTFEESIMPIKELF